MSPMEPQRIWTVGHSTRSGPSFVALLKHYGIEMIADVRRHPGSRRLPQFMSETLQAALEEQGIGYRWLGELGGRRRASTDSPASAWRNPSFRGYAEHLKSAEFAAGLQQLLSLAAERPTAMMCAEVLWWRCHRALISDVMKLDGIEVLHIQDEQRLTVHPYTTPARLEKGELSYVEGAGKPLKTVTDTAP